MRTHDICGVLAREEELHLRLDGRINQQLLRIKLRGAARDAAKNRILSFERLDEGRLIFKVCGDYFNVDLSRWSDIFCGWADEGCDVERAVLEEFIDEGGADAPSWL